MSVSGITEAKARQILEYVHEHTGKSQAEPVEPEAAQVSELNMVSLSREISTAAQALLSGKHAVNLNSSLSRQLARAITLSERLCSSAGSALNNVKTINRLVKMRQALQGISADKPLKNDKQEELALELKKYRKRITG